MMIKSKLHNQKAITIDFPKIVFVILLLIFFAYGVFIARTLDGGIIPDEPAHLLMSKHYSTTMGIPADTAETITSTGWIISHNPFLYYWINGRIINVILLVYPVATDWQLMVALRLINLVYALGSVFFCYLISKEFIKSQWYQLLPPFLLTNTLMFVILSSGVNYDNLAVLCSMAGLFFLLRVLNEKEFLRNSLAWMICISIGTLVKYPILPLALFMVITWLIYVVKKRESILPFPKLDRKLILMISGLVILLGGNAAIYGYNLVAFKGILPNCPDLYPNAFCDLSPYVARYNAFAMDHKLSIIESVQMGYPDPLEYVATVWIPTMFDRFFGIAGYKVYYPFYIFYFQLLIAWIILMAVRYWKDITFKLISGVFIVTAYTITLLIYNFQTELIYGFRNFALTGRYLFPVVGLIYGLYGFTLELIRNKILQILTLLGTIALFLMFGPVQFLWHYNGVFSSWFLR